MPPTREQGDQELVAFFREVQEQDAQKAKELLSKR
jgi:hypothetical protein